MWGRLLYLHLNQAFMPIKKGGLWQGSMLSGRYKNLLTKEFRKANLPVFMVKTANPDLNPRHRKPSGSKFDRVTRPLREAKVKANLMRADEEILRYRQERINKRPYRGFDRVMKEFGVNALSVVKEAQEEAKQSAGKRNAEDEILG